MKKALIIAIILLGFSFNASVAAVSLENLSYYANSNKNGWFQLCVKNEFGNDIVFAVTTNDNCPGGTTTGGLATCPTGYASKGSIHFGDGSCSQGQKASDYLGAASFFSGWITLCAKQNGSENSVALVSAFDNCNGVFFDCPSGTSGFDSNSALRLETQNEAQNIICSASRSIDYRGFSQGSIADGWTALCTKNISGNPIAYFAEPGSNCNAGYAPKGSVHINNHHLINWQVPTSNNFCDFSQLGVGTTFPYGSAPASLDLTGGLAGMSGGIAKSRPFHLWDYDSDGQNECMRDIGNTGAHIGVRAVSNAGTIYRINVHGSMDPQGNFYHDDFDVFQVDGDRLRYLFSADPREGGVWKVSRINRGIPPYPEFLNKNAPPNYFVQNNTFYGRLRCSDGSTTCTNCGPDGPWNWTVRIVGYLPTFSYGNGYGGTITANDSIDFRYDGNPTYQERSIVKNAGGWELFFPMPVQAPYISGNHRYYMVTENASTSFLQQKLDYLLSVGCFQWFQDPRGGQITSLTVYPNGGGTNNSGCGSSGFSGSYGSPPKIVAGTTHKMFVDMDNTGSSQWSSTASPPFALSAATSTIATTWRTSTANQVCTLGVGNVNECLTTATLLPLEPANHISGAGSWYRFVFNITAPTTTGTYSGISTNPAPNYQMAQGITPFGATCGPAQIQVVPPENCQTIGDEDQDGLADCADTTDCRNGTVCGTNKKCNLQSSCLLAPTQTCPNSKATDSIIDIFDLTTIVIQMNASTKDLFYDITNDGAINISDLQATAQKIGTNCTI